MSNRLTNKDKQILSAYECWNSDDCSTEMLLQLVADSCKCDVDDVVATLIKAQYIKNNKYGQIN